MSSHQELVYKAVLALCRESPCVVVKGLPGGEGQGSEASSVLPREEHGYPDQALTLNHVPVSPNEPSGGGARL